MEAAVRQALTDHRRWLSREVPEGHHVLDTLERAGVGLNRIEPTDRSARHQRSWLLYGTPPRALREQYDLAPEILLVFSPWEITQARDVTEAERALGKDHRLDRGMVIFIARDADSARSVVAQAARQTGRMYLVVSVDDITGASDPQRWFRELLADQLTRSNLFSSGRPVFGWDFVGRNHELRSLRGRLLDGRPVGLFGLRKIGKTSMLLSLRDRLIEDAREGVSHAVPIHVDLLAVSFNQTNLDGVMRLVLEATLRVVGTLGLTGHLAMPARVMDHRERYRLEPAVRRDMVVLVLERLLEWSMEQPSSPPILLLIDEYERLLGASRIPVDEGLDFLDFLRGLNQQHAGAFNFLVAGLDARRALQARYEGRQNPLFNFLVEFPLAGLSRQEMVDLMRKVGRRLALRFEHEALDFIWKETGGHPFLSREYGRVIDIAVPPSERRHGRKSVSLRMVESLLPDYRAEVGNSMREIHATVMGLDPHAVDLLAVARTPEELLAMPATTLDALRGLGILNRSGGDSPFRIEGFGAWLRENHTILPSAADG